MKTPATRFSTAPTSRTCSSFVIRLLAIFSTTLLSPSSPAPDPRRVTERSSHTHKQPHTRPTQAQRKPALDDFYSSAPPAVTTPRFPPHTLRSRSLRPFVYLRMRSLSVSVSVSSSPLLRLPPLSLSLGTRAVSASLLAFVARSPCLMRPVARVSQLIKNVHLSLKI